MYMMSFTKTVMSQYSRRKDVLRRVSYFGLGTYIRFPHSEFLPGELESTISEKGIPTDPGSDRDEV